MHRKFFWLAALAFFIAAGPLFGAERSWNFTEMPMDQPPKDCFSTVGGEGKPGDWKLMMDEVPLALPPLDPKLPNTAPKAVVAQSSRDYTDNHFPMLILGDDTYGDFTFKTRFKILDGLTEQCAGVAFRVQDPRNFYFVRADAAANKISFCGMLKGQVATLLTLECPIQKGEWHELTVTCADIRFDMTLDGHSLKAIERQFGAGKIALLTKSDTIAYFDEPHIRFTPRETFAQTIVRDVMKDNPRLLGLKIFMVPPKATNEVRLVACNDEKEIGATGEKTDLDVIGRGVNYYRKEKEVVYVTMPLRDRNGDAVAAVRFVMKSFPGQTEENALVRAMPMLKKMEQRASAVDSLY